MTREVAIYVYDGVEVLDFAGPYEVFSTASRVFARAEPDSPPPFAVHLVGESKGKVTARAGFQVIPHFTLNEHPEIDVLIVPGGVHGAQLKKRSVLEWVRSEHAKEGGSLIASVCTGAFLLAAAGLLDGLTATTHWEDCADLARDFPLVTVKEGLRFVEHERVMTSAGISAGLDMALSIVARFSGQDLAKRTARQMDYEWREMASP